MSAALVSAFYDAGDLLCQNRKNLSMQTSMSGRLRPDQQPSRGVIGSSRHNNKDDLFTGLTQFSQDRCSPNSLNSPQFNTAVDSDQMHSRLERSDSMTSNVNSSRYKTELCRPFEESGHCKYGDKCQFAHGARELRTLSRHPKYKTELCRTFHTIGFCPYGPRCHFIHNEDERRLSQLFQLRQPSPPPMPAPRCRQVAPPVIHRPKALSFADSDFSSMAGRDMLGSTADSPPSSVTDSPTRSPTFLGDEPLFGSVDHLNHVFAPIPATAPIMPSSQSAFPFDSLNVNTGDAIANLAATLQATSLSDTAMLNAEIVRECLYRMRMLGGGSSSLPSPPESLSDADSGVSTCGSPLEVSRGLHLDGIFGAGPRLLDN